MQESRGTEVFYIKARRRVNRLTGLACMYVRWWICSPRRKERVDGICRWGVCSSLISHFLKNRCVDFLPRPLTTDHSISIPISAIPRSLPPLSFFRHDDVTNNESRKIPETMIAKIPFQLPRKHNSQMMQIFRSSDFSVMRSRTKKGLFRPRGIVKCLRIPL